jgi:hypothetical protein
MMIGRTARPDPRRARRIPFADPSREPFMSRPATALALVLLAGVPARAGTPPLLTLRELTVRADAVVLAEPADRTSAGRVRVRELLKGAAPRPGAVVAVGGLDACVRRGEQPDWDRVDATLLFLRAGPAGRFDLVASGVRLHTRDGEVWWPAQPRGADGFRMVPQEGVSWGAAVLRVRSDAAEATRLLAACGLADAALRDRSLLEWVERHRNEFSDGRESAAGRLSFGTRNPGGYVKGAVDLDTRGWGELQLLPFTRVLEGRVPADCWRAVSLYAELHGGAAPPGAAAAFASREARALLLAVARDGRQLAGQRARALRLLGEPAVSAAVPADGGEREALLGGLLPLLGDREPARRGLAARAVAQACGRERPPPERVVEALARAYKAEPPGPARNALAETLYDLAGPGRWPVPAGRPRGGLALIRDLGLRDNKLFFWVTLRAEPAASVREPPTLMLERLGDDGSVAETKKQPLRLPSPDWHGGPLYAEAVHTDLKPGTWRLRVTGVTGPEKAAWESEPRTLRVEVPGPARPRSNQSVLGTILRSVTGAPPVYDMPTSPDDKAKRTVALDGEPF